MNREEQIAFNQKKDKLSTYRFTTGALFFILLASVRYYYEGYKGTDWILGTCYILAGLGWITLFLFFNARFIAQKKLVFKQNKGAWFKYHGIKAARIMISILVSAGYVIVVGELADQRIHRILATGPTITTTALVSSIDTIQTKNGIKYAAIIEYTVKTTVYKKLVYEAAGDYEPGKKYKLKYAAEYPEMFEIYR